MTDGDDAHAPRHAPLHRNGEYMRWLLGDLLLDIGTGIGAFAFPLIIVTLAATFGDVAEGPDSAEMAEFIFAMCVVSAMLLGVITVIGLTSEYTHNTIRPTYAATPARRKVLFAKLIVSTGVAIAVDALAVIVTWLSGSTIFNSRGGKTAIGRAACMVSPASATGRNSASSP